MILDDLCYVQIVTAHRGGTFTAGEAMRFGSLHNAVEECEVLQADFDVDAEPRRAFVLDAARVPIWAGRARGIAPGRALAQPRARRRVATSMSDLRRVFDN